MAQAAFENRAWTQGALNAGRRVQLYRDAVNATWSQLQRLRPRDRLSTPGFWLAARRAFLECVFDDYDADVALTFFYSTMRIAFDAVDIPVEYADDGLAENSHVQSANPITSVYPTGSESLVEIIERILRSCGFHAPFQNLAGDAALAAHRLAVEWRGAGPPRDLEILNPVLFRDREAYVVGKLRSTETELPVVFALCHEGSGIRVDAVLAGTEDMRNILFVSTRSTFVSGHQKT